MKNKIGKFKLDFELPSDFNDKSVKQDISLNVYKINYSYKTKRGNSKESHRYLVSPTYEDAEVCFINYINNFNKENEHRMVSNVKILGTAYIGTATL